jgi:hypothetical protein
MLLSVEKPPFPPNTSSVVHFLPRLCNPLPFLTGLLTLTDRSDLPTPPIRPRSPAYPQSPPLPTHLRPLTHPAPVRCMSAAYSSFFRSMPLSSVSFPLAPLLTGAQVLVPPWERWSKDSHLVPLCCQQETKGRYSPACFSGSNLRPWEAALTLPAPPLQSYPNIFLCLCVIPHRLRYFFGTPTRRSHLKIAFPHLLPSFSPFPPSFLVSVCLVLCAFAFGLVPPAAWGCTIPV